MINFKWEFDKRYWIIIGVAVIAHLIALGCTYHAIENKGSMECNPIMANAFTSIGYSFSGLLSIIMIVGAMIAIPYLWKENKVLAWKSVLALSFFAALMSFDAFHDVLVITGSDAAYTTAAMFNTVESTLNIPSRC